jgi:hypothetical protein
LLTSQVQRILSDLMQRTNEHESGKGVRLEEIAIMDSRDALALLTKGSRQRQIAVTKFNDHSSRSHSVYSITAIHTKDTSSIGDDLLRDGRLDLVDLTRSENTVRFDAENKRARKQFDQTKSLYPWHSH